LTDAGFEHVTVETMSRTLHFDDAATFLRMNAMALVGMSTGSATMTDEERLRIAGEIAAESRGVLSAFVDGGTLAFDISSNVATARG
jgi:hypothetical protein